MTAHINFEDGLYHVQIHTTLAGDKYSSWHTCRAFVNQGDAFLFRDMCNANKIIPERYAMTYRRGTACVSMNVRNGQPVLKVRTA